MGHRLQQFLPFGWIIDLGEFLRQIQVIPADGLFMSNRNVIGQTDPIYLKRVLFSLKTPVKRILLDQLHFVATR